MKTYFTGFEGLLRPERENVKAMIMEREMVSDVARVYELWNEYTDACHAGDFERWMSLWINDGLQMPPDVPRRIGKEAIREGKRGVEKGRVEKRGKVRHKGMP